MKVSWRVLSLASGVVLGAMVGAACTVTTSSGDDAGLFGDSGTGADTSTTGDSGSGGDTGSGSCTARSGVYADGGADPIDFGSAACNSCMDQSCCTAVGNCFEDPTGQCQEFEDCLNPTVDAGDDGGFQQTCQELYPSSVDLHNAWANCMQTSCNTQCQ